MDPSQEQIAARASGSRTFTRFAGLAAILLACAALFAGLGDIPLQDPDEGRNAEIGREMSVSGAWLVPTFNGIAYLDKPCFYFKLVALSVSLFGASESAVRLTSALAALALVGVIYFFCRHEFGALSASLSVIVISATPMFFAFARMVIFDMTLALFVTMSVIAGYLAEANEGPRRGRWWAASSFAAALATLVKGPVGFIVPGLVLVIYFLSERRPGAIKRLLSPINFLVFFATVLPWFIGVTLQRPDFPEYGLIEETFRRYTTDTFNRTAPWFFYGPVVLVGFMPWSILLLCGIVALVRHRRLLSSAERLFLVWAAVVIAFFSTSQSKLPGYVLTGVVALGVLVGRLFSRAIEHEGGASSRVIRIGSAILGAGCILAAAVSWLDVSRFPALTKAHFFEYVARNWEVLPMMRAALIVIGLAGILTAVWFRPFRAIVPFVLFPILLLPSLFGAVSSEIELRSSRALAERVRMASEGSTVACLASFPHGLPYYLGQPVVLFTRNGHELRSRYIKRTLTRTTDWPETVVPLAKSEEWLDARTKPVYLMGDDEQLAALEAVAAKSNQKPALIVPGWYGLLLSRGPR